MSSSISSSDQFTSILHEWIKVFMRRTGQDFKRFMDDSKLSFSQVNTLMRLHFAGQADISDIGSQLGISNAAASQMVERLVQMGLLERTEDKEDRRVKRLSLTSQGDAQAEKLVNIRRRWMEKFIESLNPDDRENICNALQKLTDAALKIED
jgi:DNA-binding MarR family transcriptional regulator